MRLQLFTETSGDKPFKERKWFVDEDRVSWDQTSPLPTDLFSVIKAARRHGEAECGSPLRLHQIQLMKVGPVKESEGWFYWACFFPIEGGETDVSVALDLFGEIIEPEVRFFDDEDTYCRYAYPSLHGDDEK
jgi:hypothetical protein